MEEAKGSLSDYARRLKAWKVGLERLADEIHFPITLCHYPPGTSKWNKIEHRLFSFISLNWKARPLINYETVVNLTGGTRTRSWTTDPSLCSFLKFGPRRLTNG